MQSSVTTHSKETGMRLTSTRSKCPATACRLHEKQATQRAIINGAVGLTRDENGGKETGKARLCARARARARSRTTYKETRIFRAETKGSDAVALEFGSGYNGLALWFPTEI